MSPIADQYRILGESAGCIDRIGRGFLRLEGRDASSFLQALVTNDLGTLTPSQGVYAVLLTPQGRLVADFEIFLRGDGLLAAVAPGLAPALVKRLDDLIFTEDVRVSDATAELADVLVAGGAATRVLGEAFGLDPSVLAALPELGQVDVGDAWVARSGEVLLDAFHVVGPAARRDEIVRRLESAGEVPIGEELVHALRVAAGRPAFGVDMTAETIPLEAGLLDRAISTTKGCYVGQEIIIRILHRGSGRVARRLVQLAWPASGPLPAAGIQLFREGRPIGHLTSVAPSLTGAGAVALGYVARDAAVVDQRVDVGEAGPIARITAFAR